MTIAPFLTVFSPSVILDEKRGSVFISLSGYTPLSLMLVVSVKLLNMPPNFIRGDQDSISGIPRNVSSSFLTA
ncbi:MAG: hypothetical protein A4E60_03556 [Syntrophorhabdus sp. PtaB.Bin047]|nr:MAG: hypothetical protein A4E60_03556 [Syntrophorhabdus sp. PtaB.Bin047]